MAATTTLSGGGSGGVTPSIRFLFGLEDGVDRNILFVDENTVIYPCGHSVIIYNVENKSQEFLHSSSHVQKITALALSNNKKFLAVAELADVPTITIYDVDKRRKKRELKQPSVDGTPGVEILSLDFSQDGKLVLAQGAAPTWTCVLWAWEKNKPVSQVNVHAEMSKTITKSTFHPLDHSLVCCSGNGVVRFFRIVDNLFKAMPSSIGKHEPQNFLSHAFLRDKDELLIATTDSGELILFENNDWRMVLPMSPGDGKAIHCVVPFSQGFLCGCDDGLIRLYSKSDDRMEMFTLTSTFSIKDAGAKVTSLCVSPSEDNLLCATDTKQLFVLGLSDTEIMQAEDMAFRHLITPFHEPNAERVAEVTGLDVCVRKDLVVTCGADRTVRVWNSRTHAVEIFKKFDESPLSAAFHPNGLQVIVGFGDKLRIMDLLMDDLAVIREFSISGCDDCKYSHGGHMFAAAQGSMVQVINAYTCTILHTLRGLKGKVKSIAWSSDDRFLFTASADGSLVRWDLQTGSKTGDYFDDSGFLMDDRYNWNCIVVDPSSTNDDVVLGVGRLADAAAAKSALVQIKFPPPGTDNTAPQLVREVSLGHYAKRLVVNRRHKCVMVGSFDTPATIYTAPYPFPPSGSHGEGEVHFTKMHAHRQGIVGMTLSPDEHTLFTTSLDGCFAVLDVGMGGDLDDDNSSTGGGAKDSSSLGLDDGMMAVEGGLSEDVLVRHSQILESNQETEKLNEKVAELKMYNEYQLRLKGLRHTEKLEQQQERFEETLSAELEKIRKLSTLKEHTRVKHLEKLSTVRDRHADEIENMDVSYKRKIELEKDRFAQLLKEKEEIQAQWEKENAEYIETHKRGVEEIKQKYTELLEAEKLARERCVQEKQEKAKSFQQDTDLMELDAGSEIDELKKHYESQLIAEREATLRLKGENILMKNKHESLLQDISDQKEEIKTLVKRETERYSQIDRLDKDIVSHSKEIEERDKTIREKDRRIYELKKKNQELEKFKFVLDYKIKELKRQIEPRTNEIAELKKQTMEMEQELEQYHKSNNALKLMIGELRLKMQGMRQEYEKQQARKEAMVEYIKKFKKGLAATYQYTSAKPETHDRKNLKHHIKKLYAYYSTHTGPVLDSGDQGAAKKKKKNKGKDQTGKRGGAGAGGGGDDDDETGGNSLQREYSRQREYLENTVSGLKHKMVQDAEMHRTEKRRLIRENITLTKEFTTLQREKKMWQKNQLRRAGKTGNSRLAYLTNAEADREIALQQQKIDELREQLAALMD